jgi:hypothetical protein
MGRGKIKGDNTSNPPESPFTKGGNDRFLLNKTIHMFPHGDTSFLPNIMTQAFSKGDTPLASPVSRGYTPRAPQNGVGVEFRQGTFSPYGRAFLSRGVFFTLAADQYRELKRGCAPLTISSPSPLGKGIQGMGPSLPNTRNERSEGIFIIDYLCPRRWRKV